MSTTTTNVGDENKQIWQDIPGVDWHLAAAIAYEQANLAVIASAKISRAEAEEKNPIDIFAISDPDLFSGVPVRIEATSSQYVHPPIVRYYYFGDGNTTGSLDQATLLDQIDRLAQAYLALFNQRGLLKVTPDP